MENARSEQIARLKDGTLDVLVIGGGINGAGVIRDLALRAQHSGAALRVGLVEQHHFASGTSGKNSQLIHGGLRYLKYLQIALVREALHERSTLLRIAPQFVKPLAFLLPMYGLKSRVIYGTGLWLYDRLAGQHAIERHRILDKGEVGKLEPGMSRDHLTAAAVFYDAGIPSARFVVENVLDAVARGAIAANYVHASSWEKADGEWRTQCENALSGERFEVRARKVVDARGAWSDVGNLRLVRGSHIVVPRVNAGDLAIAHFEPNGRIVFFIPWGSRHQLTLIGTTDEDHAAGPDHVGITPDEMTYLLGVLKKLYPAAASAEPISTFSSLRPLVRGSGESATGTSRGHKIWNSADGVLHIAGGKYTTYRLMSEEASDLVCKEVAPALASLHLTAETPFTPADREIGDAMEQHLSDYLYITTYLGYEQRWSAEALRPYAEALGRRRGWDEGRVQQEIQNVAATAIVNQRADS